MSISDPFIRRPVATTLVMLGLLLFGALSFRTLPVSDLPSVDFPTINVSAGLPGASPETMATAVATPLERQFSTIDGLDSMTSISTLGNVSITLQFSLKRDINDVPPDVDAAIARASRLLPPGMPSPPSYRKVNPADLPVLYLALTSPTLPMWQLNEYADTLMAQRISMVNGVAQVNVFGQQRYAVRVQVDPFALASRGIGINEVEQAVQRANVNLPVGTVEGEHRTFTLQTTGQLLTAEPYGDIIVAYRQGSPVRLRDVGRAVDGVEDDKMAAWFANREVFQRTLMLAIQRQPGANTVEVVDAIREILPQLESYLPPSVTLRLLYDRSQTIRHSVNEVEFTLMLSLALVVMVIFLFLRNLSATTIPSLALPLSVVGTFAVMALCGFSINNLSLMALTLSIGFVVDDAIVVLENIVRHMEMGKRPMEAAFDGARQIGFTILSMTISLAAVFIPILFMGGILGRLFHEFAVVIISAILISGVVSLTLTPMLASRFLRPPREQKHGALSMRVERVFQRMLAFYQVSLRWVLAHRFVTLTLNIGIVIAAALLAWAIPKGFVTDEDTSQIFAVTETPQGTSFAELTRRQSQVVELLRDDPNIEGMTSSIGGGFAGSMGGMNFGRMFIALKPRSERELGVSEVIQQLRARAAKVPGISVSFQNPPTIRLGGRLSKSLYQFALQSPDLAELYRVAPEMEARLRGMDEIQDVGSDLQVRSPQLMIDIDRDKAATLGLSPEQIESSLANGFGPRWISTIYAQNDQYRVLLELDPRYQRDPAVLSKVYVKSDTGNLVRLDAVARLGEEVGTQSISHAGQLPAVTLSFNLKPGVSLGEALAKVNEAARETLPPTVTTSLQGTAQAFESSLKGMGWLMLFTVVFIYIVLGILYESFVHPLTILSGLPSAAFGALLVLMGFGHDLNVYSLVGLIMLVGIVKKNAIMQIDFALEAQRTRAKSPIDAIYEGCIVRFRPIMMTTMAALMAALPLALSTGSDSRRQLGLTAVGGLLISQLVTLYLTPIVYTYFDELQDALQRRGANLRASFAKVRSDKPVGVETV